MELLKLLVSNYFIDVAVISWFSAQLIKTLLFYLQNGILQAERMVGAGGMPSAHSAFVCSITIAIAKKVGYSSPEFALAVMFAFVTMYDAMGVRREAGEHAKLLNKYLNQIETRNADVDGDGIPDKKVTEIDLKEFIGHTPLEVLGGVLLGILVGMLIPA